VSTAIGIVAVFCIVGVLVCHWCGRRMDKLARQVIDSSEWLISPEPCPSPGVVDASQLRPSALGHDEDAGELEQLVAEVLFVLEEADERGRTASRTSTATAASRPA
jgi:hypothetical protein